MDNSMYRRVRVLFGAVLGLSLATLGAAAAVGGTQAVWIRGTIMVVIAAVLLVLARRACHGSRAAHLRMRIMTTVAPIAIVVIVALPNDGFPLWIKVEQAVVGILLAAAAVLASRKGADSKKTRRSVAYPGDGQRPTAETSESGNLAR